jgi:hypothetical protein
LSPIDLTQHLVDHASYPSGFEMGLPASLADHFWLLLGIEKSRQNKIQSMEFHLL